MYLPKIHRQKISLLKCVQKISGEVMVKTKNELKNAMGECPMWSEEDVLKEIGKELLKVKIAFAMKKRLRCSTSHIGSIT